MNEPRLASRIVEVRETFTPSEELRDALGNFLAPTMETYKKDTIKNSFVLKSWRRKIMHESDYYGPHGEKYYSVQKAEMAFRALQNVSLDIGPKIGYSDQMKHSQYNRVILRPRSVEYARKIFNILNFTENNIEEFGSPEMNSFVYLDIAKRNTGRYEQVLEARDDLYEKVKDPSTANLYTINPDSITAKSKLEHLRSS